MLIPSFLFHGSNCVPQLFCSSHSLWRRIISICSSCRWFSKVLQDPGSQIDPVQTWMDLFGYNGSPSHTCHTSMDAGVNWVRDQWRDVKYLGKVTEGMDQNGRTEHVQLHANQSNHLGCRSKNSAKKVGFQKGLQEGFRDVRSRIQLSDLNHREDIDWKSENPDGCFPHWIWSYHDPLGTKWCYVSRIRPCRPSFHHGKTVQSSGWYARLDDKMSFSEFPNLRLRSQSVRAGTGTRPAENDAWKTTFETFFMGNFEHRECVSPSWCYPHNN